VAPAGGTICQPKRSIGEYGFIAIVQDTAGNTIGCIRASERPYPRVTRGHAIYLRFTIAAETLGGISA